MTDLPLPPGAARLYGRWDEGRALERLNAELPGAVLGMFDFRAETTLAVALDQLLDVLAFLRDDPDCAFDFLTDVTAVHWPDREQPFEVVYHLYSMGRNVRLRVKAAAGPEPRVPSSVSLWPAANWLERECFDMFGVVFEDHPDLRRILMPEDFDRWPMRKDFPLKV